MKNPTRLSLIAFLALLIPAVLPAQQNAGGTANISPGQTWTQSYYQNVPQLTEVATHESLNPLLKGMTKACNDNADALDAATRKVATRASSSSVTPEMRSRGNALVLEGRESSAWSRRMGGWVDSAGKFLKVVDVVSTGAQAMGYLAEGDRTGATTVLVNDISKKTCAGAGALALSEVPVVGQAVGALAGEAFHNSNIKPLIEAREKELHNAEADAKMAGKPWMPPNLAINPGGAVYELPPNYFLNPLTGTIDHRNPDDQKQYENGQHTQWLNDRAMNTLEGKALSGEITPEQYGRGLDSFRRRDPNQPWQPDLGGEGQAAGAAGEGEAGQDEENGQAEGQGEVQGGPAEGQTAPETKPSGGVLDFVTAQRVTATGQIETDYSYEQYENISTTKIILSFWNVGGMVGGYGGVRMETVETFTLHPAVLKNSCSGSFTGGPNGTFTMSCDGNISFTKSCGNASTLVMSNGQTISGGKMHLTVQNSGAFDNWPAQYR